MCNISGYIGDRRAAPVLIEMMRRQEGYCGGYYTGITTLHDGKLYTRKVLGDVNRLLAETDAMELPGNVGVIHSRSNSGGDVRWGHPFVTSDNKFSVSLNGATGKYETHKETENVARMLYREGARLALDFLMPYLIDKSKWFLPPDIEHDKGWPARASFMVFAGLATADERYLKLYSSLPYESYDVEVRRNLAIRQPILLIP